jgi:hypothetical protein
LRKLYFKGCRGDIFCLRKKEFHPLFQRLSTDVHPVIKSGVRDTTLCDKVCQWLVTGQWFSPGTLVYSINKTDHHDITEILLKVALNTINQTKSINIKQTDMTFLHLQVCIWWCFSRFDWYLNFIGHNLHIIWHFK